MSKPSRPSDPSNATGQPRTFFVTARSAGGRRLFQTERMANLFVAVLRDSMRMGKLTVHHFVVMPDHIHILFTVPGSATLEKTMQLIKGGFSFRANRELGFGGEIWRRGYSDVRVPDERSFRAHQKYIDNNPVRAGIAQAPEEYPYGSAGLKMRTRAGAEAQNLGVVERHD